MRTPGLSAVTLLISTASVWAVPATQPAASPEATKTPAVNSQTSLAKRGGELKFDQIALTDAMDYFRDATGANFVVDWKALEAVGLSKETPVSLRLRGVAIGVALRKTLDAAGPGLLSFYVDQNVIHVTSKIEADNRMITRVYSVADLLADAPDFTDVPQFSLQQSSGSRSGGSGGGGGSSSSGNLFGSGGGSSSTNTKTKSTSTKAQDLIDLIQQTVHPDVWNVNGGKAAIRYQAGTIVVTAPQAVQDEIGGK